MIIREMDPRVNDLFTADQEFLAMPTGHDVAGGHTAGWERGCDGAVWIRELGALAFNDIGHSRRLTWTPGGEVLLLHQKVSGAVGSARDQDGRFVSCDWDTKRVTRLEHDGSVTAVATQVSGHPLANPDDVVVAPDGAIYFTDLWVPFPPPPPGAISTSGVYRVSPDLSEVKRLDCDIANPGGLALSGDGHTLYVSDQDARCVVVYPLSPDGELGAARRLPAMTGDSESMPHGMCLDGDGNLYVGGPGGLWVFGADGVPLGVVQVNGTRINDVAFGGEAGTTLFVVTSSGIGCIETKAAPPQPVVASPAVLTSRGEPIPYPQGIERLDPALDAIIAPGTEIQNYCHGGFFEDLGGGPHYKYAASLEGTFWRAEENCLYFSDIGNSRRLRFNPETKEITLAQYPTGNTNGATLDCEGRVIQAEHSGRCVSRMEHDGSRTVLIDHVDGKRLNHPNDVVVRSDGDIFFTDPWWDFGMNETTDTGFAGVYHLTADLKTVTLIGKDYRVCNGLAFSHDEKILFVNDSFGLTDEMGPHIRAYDVLSDGSIDSASSRIWAALPQGERKGTPDGMKVDQAGNVFCGGAGGLWVFDKTGKHLGIVAHGDTQTNNLCFGGPDWKTLYFVSWVGLHSVQLSTPGIPIPPRPRP